VLALAGTGVALASVLAGPGGASPGGPRAQARVVATCSDIISSFGRPGLANRMRERPQDAGCARPGAGQARAARPRAGSPAICVPLQAQAGHPGGQFGVRHRCYPGLF